VAVTIRIPDTVHEKADELSKERDMSIKEAVRYMCREGDFDV
jgi:antitoxin component of RelBE/YafQ-DinJ toxin-antitoxin module